MSEFLMFEELAFETATHLLTWCHKILYTIIANCYWIFQIMKFFKVFWTFQLEKKYFLSLCFLLLKNYFSSCFFILGWVGGWIFKSRENSILFLTSSLVQQALFLFDVHFFRRGGDFFWRFFIPENIILVMFSKSFPHII